MVFPRSQHLFSTPVVKGLKTFFYFRLKIFRDFDTLLQITPYSPLQERIILRTMNYLCIT